jgi:hypothetical protein
MLVPNDESYGKTVNVRGKLVLGGQEGNFVKASSLVEAGEVTTAAIGYCPEYRPARMS